MAAESIAKALAGRKVGTAWMARYPAHADREPKVLGLAADAQLPKSLTGQNPG
jgi:hypothetical protein